MVNEESKKEMKLNLIKKVESYLIMEYEDFFLKSPIFKEDMGEIV